MANTNPNDPYLTRQQAAKLLGLTLEGFKSHQRRSRSLAREGLDGYKLAALGRPPGLPEPDQVIEGKPLWLTSTIKAWDATRRVALR